MVSLYNQKNKAEWNAYISFGDYERIIKNNEHAKQKRQHKTQQDCSGKKIIRQEKENKIKLQNKTNTHN